MCGDYPWLPKRHGHIYCPSWDYTGPYQDTIRACTKSCVVPNNDKRDVGYAIYVAWMQNLPEWSLDYVNLSCVDEARAVGWDCAGHLSKGVVDRTARYLEPLAVTIMDKCNQCLLIR